MLPFSRLRKGVGLAKEAGREETVSVLPVLKCGSHTHILVGNTLLNLRVQWAEAGNGVGT